jgi:hypothetical protein
MFVRFRQNRSRLQVSLIETRRVSGKVRHDHVASLGSVIQPATVADRVTFWSSLHERMTRLSNRIDAAAQGKIMGEVHARVPMPTPDEQRALQLENARVEAERWSAVGDFTGSDVASREKLIEHHEAVIAAARPVIAIANDHVQAAQDRVAAIERGEVVDGLGKPQDLVTLFKQLGITEADLRHYRFLHEAVPEEHLDEFVTLFVNMRRKVERGLERKAALAMLRKYGDGYDNA